MSRGRMTIPAELDVLDSPLSPIAGPFSGLTGLPASALAERIFNDPDSWEDTDGDEGDYPEDVEDDDTFGWLAEEIEKIRVHSAGHGGFQLSSEKRESKDSSLLRAPDEHQVNMDWRGIAQRGAVRPISLAGMFDQSAGDFSDDIQHQLSKILDSGGIKHHIAHRPLSASLSPPLTGSSTTSESFPSASSAASSINRTASPAPTQSASATLSFLEYYGIYPDSPLLDSRKSIAPRKKSMRRKPTLKVPSSQPNRLSLAIPSTNGTTKPLMVRRASGVLPPGLSQEPRPMTPPGLSRPSTPPTRKWTPTSEDEGQIVEVAAPPTDISPRSRPLPTTAPPPYPRSPSPSSKVGQASSSSTPVRRLPTIPPDAGPPSSSPPRQSITRPMPSAKPPSSSMLSPPAPASNPHYVPLSAAFGAGAATTPFSPHQSSSYGGQTPVFSARPPSTVRSPLGVPVGPRTRARMPSGDAGRPGSASGHRPPVLRL